MCAEDNGGSNVNINRKEAQQWENFTLINPVDISQKYALRTSSGYYLVAENGGGGEVNWNRREPKEWETFKFVPIGTDGYAL